MFSGILLSIISAVTARLAFPEYNFYLLAWVALIPFIYAYLKQTSLKKVFLISFCFSLFYFGLSFDWLPSFYIWAPSAVINLGWLVYALYNGLFLSLLLLGAKVLTDKLAARESRFLNVASPLIFAAAWLVFDWLRSLSVFANTNGSLSLSQYLFLDFIQLAKYLGPNGLSFLIILFNYLLASSLLKLEIKQKKELKNNLYFLAIFGLLFITLRFGCPIDGHSLPVNDIFTPERAGFSQKITAKDIELQQQTVVTTANNHLLVSLYQPNIAQEKKLDPYWYPHIKTQYLSELRYYYDQEKQQPDLVVMPETIVPQFLLNNKNFLFDLRNATDSDIIFGIPRQGKNNQYFNSVVYFDLMGNIKDFHDKKYLVPFGEFLPFKFLFKPLFKKIGYLETEYGRGQNTKPLQGKYAISVCFESTLPYQPRGLVKNGAQLIFVLTNDAWFRGTAVPELHIASAVLRAVENDRYLIQAANTGISAFIDNHGRIIKASRYGQKAWLTRQVELRTTQTPYTQYGEVLVFIAILFLLVIGLKVYLD